MARPKKAEQERRDDRVEIRLTTAERVHLEQVADHYGLTSSEFMRRRALGYRLPAYRTAEKSEHAAIATALIRIGVNLNQIAKRLNAGWHSAPELPALIVRVNGALDRLYGPTAH